MSKGLNMLKKMYRFFQVSDLRDQYYKDYKEDSGSWVKEVPYHASHALGKALNLSCDHKPQDCPHCFKVKRHTGDLIDRSVPLRYQHKFLQSSHLVRISWCLFTSKPQDTEQKLLTEWENILKYKFDCPVRLLCTTLSHKHVVPTLPNVLQEWEELCRQLKVNDQVILVIHGKATDQGLICSDQFYLDSESFKTPLNRISKGCKIWLLNNAESSEPWLTLRYAFSWEDQTQKVKGTRQMTSDMEHEQSQVVCLSYRHHPDFPNLSHAFHLSMAPCMYRKSLFALLKDLSQKLPKGQVTLHTNIYVNLKKVFWGFG